MNITTNNQWRDFVYKSDVPNAILENQFDWLDSDITDGFINYRGYWYHLSEFINVPDSIKGVWDGWIADSAFSGVLIRYSEDFEQFRIATYTC